MFVKSPSGKSYQMILRENCTCAEFLQMLQEQYRDFDLNSFHVVCRRDGLISFVFDSDIPIKDLGVYNEMTLFMIVRVRTAEEAPARMLQLQVDGTKQVLTKNIEDFCGNAVMDEWGGRFWAVRVSEIKNVFPFRVLVRTSAPSGVVIDDTRLIMAGGPAVRITILKWSKKSHVTFPRDIRISIFEILMCHKYGTLRIIPKPVMFIIIKNFAEMNNY